MMFDFVIEDGGLMTRLSAIAASGDRIPRQVFEDIGTIVLESIYMNFAVEGRPSQWAPSKAAIKEGRKTLTKSGDLSETAEISAIGDSFVEIGTKGLPYENIHQFGGTIEQDVSDAQKNLFWRKFYESDKRETMWRAMALSEHLTIHVRSRRWFMLQDQDVSHIMDILGSFIMHQEERFAVSIS